MTRFVAITTLGRQVAKIMRKPARWMVLTDERILEYLNSRQDPASAATIHESGALHAARSTISKRLNRLAEADMLEKYPNGVFTLTGKGEKYLKGEYNAETGEME